MARSESAVTEDDPEAYHIEYVEGSDGTRLVVSTDRITVTVEGDAEEMRRQFEEYQAAALGLPSDALRESVEEYPMPDPDELESVTPGEVYDDG